MTTYVELTYWQVGLAALLIGVNAAVSILLQLRIEKTLAIASIRTVAQLLLIGLVLEWVFRLDQWYIVLGLAALMTLIAGITAVGRSDRHYRGMTWNTIISVWVSTWLITAYVMFIVIQRADRWYQPQYVIPLLGMALGNTLNGISLGLKTLLDSFVSRRTQVETLLALGATRWESARRPVGHAVRTGMIPIINSMMVVGIVSLPGMMTGQLVSGMNPLQAVKYQTVIMFMVASTTALGTVGIVLLSYRQVFNRNHQFLVDHITSKANR